MSIALRDFCMEGFLRRLVGMYRTSTYNNSIPLLKCGNFPLLLPPPTHPPTSALRNMQLFWNVLLLTQMSVVKTLMIFKWPFMAGLDDIFMGRFLFRINFVSCILSQWFRYWLGSMYETHEFQILTGIKVRYL